MSDIATLLGELIITQDFNLHVNIESADTSSFLNILDSFDLVQRVDFPTHVLRHTLDLTIFPQQCEVMSVTLSDRIFYHFAVLADLNIDIQTHSIERKKVHYRNIKSIDIEAVLFRTVADPS